MATEPEFIPRDGQVNFTNMRWCPVINCVVQYNGKILLVRRSDDMRLYPGYWNGISGFIDDQKSLTEKVYEELHEELGLPSDAIRSVALCGVFVQDAPEIGKTWIVHAILVEVHTDNIKTDWEASAYEWCSYPVVDGRALLPGFEAVLELTCHEPNRVTFITPF